MSLGVTWWWRRGQVSLLGDFALGGCTRPDGGASDTAQQRHDGQTGDQVDQRGRELAGGLRRLAERCEDRYGDRQSHDPTEEGRRPRCRQQQHVQQGGREERCGGGDQGVYRRGGVTQVTRFLGGEYRDFEDTTEDECPGEDHQGCDNGCGEATGPEPRDIDGPFTSDFAHTDLSLDLGLVTRSKGTYPQLLSGNPYVEDWTHGSFRARSRQSGRAHR